MEQLMRFVFPLMLSVLVLGTESHGQVSGVDLEYFEKEVRPLLSEQCYECHSGSSKKLKGGLYVDSLEGLLEGGDTGPALVVGQPDESLLIEAVRYHNEDLQMPPKTRLPVEAVAVLEDWVRRGAPWPEEEGAKRVEREKFDLESRRAEHWCWSGPRQVEPPAVKNESWVLQPLDRFVLARLEASGLVPAVDADRGAWIRRVSFDLNGLPPTAEEIEAFLADESPGAHEKVVDRLLNSPAYAETWARHWLDLVRYAESYGHEFDYNIPEAWRYRDYVVRAFREDVAHDQMVKEAIAGDLLPVPRMNAEDGTSESLVATGFWMLGEAVHAPTDVLGDEATRIDNQIDVATKSFLALTVSCARCHDHKFDAISTKDYYALSGYLQSTRRHLALQDPGGRIAARVGKLKEVQKEATAAAGGGWSGERTGKRAGLIEGFDEGMPEGWFRSGEAFPEAPSGFDRGEVALVGDAGEFVPGGVLHSALYGSKLQGALRSPTFRLEGPQLHLRIAAEGAVRVRVVIDGFYMADFNDLLFRGTQLKDKGVWTGGKYEWRTIAGDLRKYVGHNVYLEFLDEGDGYLAIDEIAYDRNATDRGAPGVPVAELMQPFIERVRKLEEGFPGSRRVLAVMEGTPENAKVHIRGGTRNLGEEVPRRLLTALGGEDHPAPAAASGRLELAAQIASPTNPLTARVQVNRLWHHLTGLGIVSSVDDFGVMGEEPSHPDLLDWMAGDFVAKGWSNKAMIRSIVLSRTYRMSCLANPANPSPVIEEVDPANVLLHKFRVRRLPSESIRDGILAVSGRLDPRAGGPSVPVHLTGFMEGRGRPQGGPLDGEGRRSIYTAVRRNFLPPFQLAFDMPLPYSTVGKRTSSNVPAQALVMMNDPFVREQSGLWAERLLKEADRGVRIREAWMTAFARVPDGGELAMVEKFLESQAALHGTGVEDVRVWKDFCHLLFNKKEYVFLR